MIRKKVLILFMGLFNLSLVFSQKQETSFIQEIQDSVALPSGFAGNVLRLFETPSGIVAITPEAYLKFSKAKWISLPSGEENILAVKDQEDRVWTISRHKLYSPEEKKSIDLPLMLKKDTIRCAYWEGNQILHIGTSGGLYTWNGVWNEIKELKGVCVNDIVSDASQKLYVASMDGLWRREGSRWVNLDDAVMPIGNERKYYALASGNGEKDIHFSTPHSIACIAADGNHRAWSAVQGLPYSPVRLIRVNKEGFWLGTDKGAIKKDSSWHYYNGKRWLHDSFVNDVLPLQNGNVWIATPKGINEIKK
ncbi:MAG: transcriptional regulator, partial [Chitinophagaceae bacterium]|nr:transcriptional regulator [Chitinophagaceae bacterium]